MADATNNANFVCLEVLSSTSTETQATASQILIYVSRSNEDGCRYSLNDSDKGRSMGLTGS
jgi:hypothetical protein